MEWITPLEPTTLRDYSEHAHLTQAVHELRVAAARVRKVINGHSVLMVNSTRQGGGVAEMLPKLVATLRELGIRTRWAVMGASDPAFFRLTKRLHNLIHGDSAGKPSLTAADREVYEGVARANLDELRARVRPGDLVVIHDPQPLVLGTMLKQQTRVSTVWRCHIGLDERLPSTQAAWDFLRPYVGNYDHAVFSAPEYVPEYVRDRSSIIFPAIDPLSHKNRPLRADELTAILCASGLTRAVAPTLVAPFCRPVQRLQSDGTFQAATAPDEIGFLYRPTITQISRWDRLKGFRPLLEGFVRLKHGFVSRARGWEAAHRARIAITRLVLAGPDPASIQDDPEGREVLEELCATFARLSPEIQQDVVLLALPMESLRENALMVNALQSASSVVVQNSIREGFGLTLTEAMWKGTPVIGSSACGLRQQMSDRVHGRVIAHPANPEEVAEILDSMLSADEERHLWTRSAQARVHRQFLIFSQVRSWLQLIERLVGVASAHASRAPNRRVSRAARDRLNETEPDVCPLNRVAEARPRPAPRQEARESCALVS